MPRKLEAATSVLAPHSGVVIGGRSRFWRPEEDRLGQVLRDRGHAVVFVEHEPGSPAKQGVRVHLCVALRLRACAIELTA